MKYTIQIDKTAMKFLKKQTPSQQKRLLQAIYALPDNGDIKPMSGYKDVFRLRVGTYRVLYSVKNDILTVLVLKIGNRGDVYK